MWGTLCLLGRWQKNLLYLGQARKIYYRNKRFRNTKKPHFRKRKEKVMFIKKYRFIAEVYPHLSMEAEVHDRDTRYYVNIDVNDKGEKETILEDGWWAYYLPLDKVDFNDDGDVVTDVDFTRILNEMVEFWNANPVFNVEGRYKSDWSDWPATKEGVERCTKILQREGWNEYGMDAIISGLDDPAAITEEELIRVSNDYKDR